MMAPPGEEKLYYDYHQVAAALYYGDSSSPTYLESPMNDTFNQILEDISKQIEKQYKPKINVLKSKCELTLSWMQY